MTARIPPRERLLAVARELFARHGYDGLSVRDLTARAKVNLGAVTYHFGSKEALYHAALESMARPFAETVAEVARTAPGNAVDRVEAVVRAVLEHLSRHPGTPRCLLRELTSERPLAPPVAALMKANAGSLMHLIADGQREGTIRAGDPALLALSVMSQPFYFRVASRLIEPALDVDESRPDVRARVVEHVVEGVRRTIANIPKVVT